MTYKGIKEILAEFYRRLKADPTFAAGSSDVLAKLSESTDGKLLYDGKEVTASSGIQLISKEDYDALEVKDETVFYLIVDEEENLLIDSATITNSTFLDINTVESATNTLSLDENNQLVITNNAPHTHENKTILDKLTESDEGKLLYNGETISTTNVKLITRAEYDAIEEKDEKTLYIITDDVNTNLDTNVLEKLSESDSGELLYNGKRINDSLVSLTREEYDALETKDEDTIYIISDEDGTVTSLAEQVIDDNQTTTTKTYSSSKIDSTFVKNTDFHITKEYINNTINNVYLKLSNISVNGSIDIKMTAIRLNTTSTIQEASVAFYASNYTYKFLKLSNQYYANSALCYSNEASYLAIDEDYNIYVQIGSYSKVYFEVLQYVSSFFTFEVVESLPSNLLINGYSADISFSSNS